MIIRGDCLEEMKKMPDNSVDAIVTDPPYDLTSMTKQRTDPIAVNGNDGKGNPFCRKQASKGFMGKEWDGTGIAFKIELWKEALRILKPGAHLIAFGGTRTYHRMAVAIEDAGFEVRDMISEVFDSNVRLKKLYSTLNYEQIKLLEDCFGGLGMLNWCYASGFPKSLNIGVAYNKLERDEWFKIGKAIDNFINKEVLINIWKENLNNVKSVEKQFQKKSTEIGICIQEKDFVQESAVENPNQEKSNLNANIVERYFTDLQVINIKGNTAPKNVDTIITEIKELQDPVKSAERLSQKDLVMLWNIFTAQCDVKEWLKENTRANLKVEEVLKTLRGNKKYSNEEIINVFYAVLTEILKLTILNQSETFQNLDTIQQMECASAINVIIMEYMAENLISNTVDILKSKAVDKLQGNEREIVGIKSYPREGTTPVTRKATSIMGQGNKGNVGQNSNIETKGNSEWEGFGTALKPAHEPIILARKPLSEKTIVENVLKHGTGAIDIDGCRIPTSELTPQQRGSNVFDETANGIQTGWNKPDYNGEYKPNNQGRFPANIICTDDALNDGVMTKSGAIPKGRFNIDSKNGIYGKYGYRENEKRIEYDIGSKSRYFDIDVWAEKHGLLQFPKASKRERNEGCEGLEEKESTKQFNEGMEGQLRSDGTVIKPPIKQSNFHPTVKPVHLMSWLVRLVSKEGDIVLDPFAGSGTTGVACLKLNRRFIGIEKEEEYCKIAEARINKETEQTRLEEQSTGDKK